MVLIEKTAAMSELTGIPNFLKLTDQVWTGGQPWLEHLSKLKDAGIKVIINLRAHAESPWRMTLPVMMRVSLFA